MPIVYKATNKVNGKHYFGQTIRTLEQRRAAHASSARQGSVARFHAAIRKYGIDLFEFEIVFEGDINEVRKKEEECIREYNSMNFDIGYNSKPGGCGGWIVPAHKYESWKAQRGRPREQNGKWCGLSDDELVDLASELILNANMNYVPGFASLKKMSGNRLPSIQKGSCRFGGLGGQELIRQVSDRLSLPYKPNERTAEHRKNLSASLKGRKLSAEHKSKIIGNLRIKGSSTNVKD